MGRLESDFYLRDTLLVAEELLGKRLVCCHRTRCSGQIVEVEAYHGRCDPAAHSFRGATTRNKVMFQEGGHCYVYLIYGMYHCVNVVTETKDVGAAVLIRAIEPLEGIQTMQRRRELKSAHSLADGPGKLCQALGITKKLNGEFFPDSDRIWIEEMDRSPSFKVQTSPRIGISKGTELPWRFTIQGSPWLSRPSS